MLNNCSEAARNGIVTGERQRGRGDAADVIVSLHQLLDFCGRKFGLLHGVGGCALAHAGYNPRPAPEQARQIL
jgi:hypothetical protein